MNGVSIPEQQIVSLDDIADGVRGLRIAFVNVFDGASLMQRCLLAPRIFEAGQKNTSALLQTHLF